MNESSNLFREKDTTILNIILNHILSGRDRLDSMTPAPIAGFSVAAGDTATWFAGEKDYEALLQITKTKFIGYAAGDTAVQALPGTAVLSWAKFSSPT